jgi:hypothetical protein
MFDVPLLTTGLEHVYLVSNPWPDPAKIQLREPLQFYFVTRRATLVDYDTTRSPAAELELAEYNERCKCTTLGIGRGDTLTGSWRSLFFLTH